MSYFPDLAPYSYCERLPGVVHVGWLDDKHEYTRGPVDPWFVDAMRRLADCDELPGTFMGSHFCELCTGSRLMRPSSNGEIRVGFARVTYAAPVLIVHYIEAHGYRPPLQFLAAVAQARTAAADPREPR